jgi:hypothetical protein
MSTNNADSNGEVKNKQVEQKPDKELVFDSHEIGKKEKTDYFVRVEGAEERKKEVIRRMQQQKDELIREQKAKEAAEKKDAAQKQREKQKADSKKKRAEFLKRNKVKIIAIIAAILTIIIGVAIYFILNPPLTEEQKEAHESWSRSPLNAQEFSKEIEEIANDKNRSYDDAMQWGEEQIAATDDNHLKFDYYNAMAIVAGQQEAHYDDAIRYLYEMEKLASNNAELQITYSRLAFMYSLKGDEEKKNEYSEKASQYEKELEDYIKRSGGMQ